MHVAELSEALPALLLIVEGYWRLARDTNQQTLHTTIHWKIIELKYAIPHVQKRSEGIHCCLFSISQSSHSSLVDD
jgi:hypothetical protein